MKNKVSFVISSTLSLFALAAVAGSSSPARADEMSAADGVVREMRELVLRCAVQPYAVLKTGKKVVGALQSVCSEVQVDPSGFGHQAFFRLEEGFFQVQVVDSPHSDGGDLVDLVILDAHHHVLGVVRDLLGFADPLRALLGSQAEELKEVYDPSILNRRRQG